MYIYIYLYYSAVVTLCHSCATSVAESKRLHELYVVVELSNSCVFAFELFITISYNVDAFLKPISSFDNLPFSKLPS